MPAEVSAPLATLLLFFAPGWLVLHALPPRLVAVPVDAFSLPALSFVFSVGVTAPVLWAFTALGLSASATAWLLAALLVGLAVVSRRRLLPLPEVPLPPVRALAVAAVVAGCAVLAGLTLHHAADDQTFTSFVNAVQRTGEMPDDPPFLAADVEQAPRWRMSGWTGALAVAGHVSDVEPSRLFDLVLPPLVVVAGASALYLLARVLTGSAGLGAVAAVAGVLLPLLDEPLGDSSQFRLWYRHVHQDKFVAAVVVLPVLGALVVHLLSTERGRSWMGRAALVAWLVVAAIAVHPLVVVFLALLSGGYALFTRPTALGVAKVAAAVGPALVLGAVLSVTVPEYDVGMDAVESFDRVTGEEPGATPEERVVRAHLNVGGGDRLVADSATDFRVHPSTVVRPMNLLVVLGLAAALWAGQRRLAAWVLASAAAACAAMLPPVASLLSSFMPPWQLWRLSWVAPVALAATLLVAAAQSRRWVAAPAAVAILAVAALTPHEGLRSLGVPGASNDERLARRLVEEVDEGVLLAPPALSAAVGRQGAGLEPVSFRGLTVMANAFPAERMDEAVARLRDTAAYFEAGTGARRRAAIEERWGVTHVFAPGRGLSRVER